MLPFPIKICPVEIFTRATPGSSLVLNTSQVVLGEILTIFFKFLNFEMPYHLPQSPGWNSNTSRDLQYIVVQVEIVKSLGTFTQRPGWRKRNFGRNSSVFWIWRRIQEQRVIRDLWPKKLLENTPLNVNSPIMMRCWVEGGKAAMTCPSRTWAASSTTTSRHLERGQVWPLTQFLWHCFFTSESKVTYEDRLRAI